MKKTWVSRLTGLGSNLLLLLFCHTALAAVSPDVLRVDLSPLIDASARYPTRFAVDLPHPVSTVSAGTWTQRGGRSTWSYTVRVPTAVSMSFHADHVNLPAGAVLTVTGANGTSASYRSRDIARSGLWSRPLPGDSLHLSLSVDATARGQTVLQIASLQAGYRSLGAGVADNAHYRNLMQRAASSSCTLNYSCEATAANTGPAHATVAIVVAGVVQCTGTLLNDTSADGTPYVLTARHCENGALGGGDPGAAANVTVYWDAVTPCGSSLGSIYDGTAITQTGSTTMVEQQDAWLIRLDAPPAADDAYYSGWDASGGAFSGGYSIHHALGNNKQYVGWYGQTLLQVVPGTTLNLQYSSTFWGVVNAAGNVGAGASGGALFDPSNNAVGSASLAELANGEGSAGLCPVTPLQAPSPANIAALYTALSAVWNSTADTTSTTATITLQSILDASQSGKLSASGISSLPVTLTISETNPSTGQTVSLEWSAPGAQSCTAKGGLSGDGWAGPKNASGTVTLTEVAGGQLTYALICTAAGQVGQGFVSATWQFVAAAVQIYGPGSVVSAGREIPLQWSSNTLPCTASGGNAGDGWAGPKGSSGSQSVLASVIGSATYTLTCGSTGRMATSQFTTTIVPPSVDTITSDAINMRVGEVVNLTYIAGGSCAASGGGPGDGWAGPLIVSGANVGPVGYNPAITETAPGTYTYTITCSGAGASASQKATSSVTLTFTNSPAAVSMSVSPTSAEVYTDPGAAGNSDVMLTWNSNVRPCGFNSVGPGNAQFTGPSGPGVLPSDTMGESASVAGAYVYTLTCGTAPNQAQATASASFFTTAPAVTLTVPSLLPLGVPATISWDYNLSPCTGSGGQSGDGWSGGPKSGEFFGIASQTVTESTAGPVTFAITCGSGSQIVHGQGTATVVAPQVSLAASASMLPINGPLTLIWNSNVGTCTSTINPGSSTGWGTLPQTGSFQTTEEVAGTYTYAIDCAGVTASTQVTFTGSLVTLTASAPSATVDVPVTLGWSSPPATTSCTAGGGSAGDGWTGSLASNGTKAVTAVATGIVTYSITCDFGYGPAQGQTQVTYTAATAKEPSAPTPQVKLSTDASTQVVGSTVTLSWTSQNASACTASGGASGDGWSGNLALSGNLAVTESSAGSFSYGITCTGAPPAAKANAAVAFTAATVAVTGSSGKGGGGILDLVYLLSLVLAAGRRMHLRLSAAS